MKLKQYDIAVMNHEPDAVVWRVTRIVDKQNVEVVDAALAEKLAERNIKTKPSLVYSKHLLPLSYQQLQAWNGR